jgi:uncharacterized protein with HEPN domain
MSRHDDTVALRHMLDYARTAQRMVAGRSRQDLDTDEMLRLALIRAVEVIGEAAGRVSAAGHKAHPAIPWPQILGARHRLIHGYDTVNLDILWDIVTLDLPPLIAQLQTILPNESEPGS